jgi:tetratricopeptide (TPR) repeat protein
VTPREVLCGVANDASGWLKRGAGDFTDAEARPTPTGSRMSCRSTVALAFLIAGPAPAQGPKLGTVDFPTSGGAAAQEHFVRGVLYLHSFEYPSAAEAFRQAQDVDSGFALAYWGEAMTYNHPLWNEWDDAAARGALARLAPTPAARRAKAPTERERLYLDAIEALWVEGPKPQRDTAYHRAMERLVHAFPEDDEARAFYALATLGLSGTTRVFASYMRAAATVQPVFDRNPDHPGAAHYLIHAFDDPVHAPLGLPAARAYSAIAPDAAHAQHMTTHIFLALGMWDDVVAQNTVAAEQTGWGPGHYTAWLGYGLLQQGRFADAEAHLARARREMPREARAGPRGYLIAMRAHHVINTERWIDASLAWELEATGAWALSPAIDGFVRGYAALRRGDRAAARGRLAAMAMPGGGDGDGPAARALRLALEAAIAHDAGDGEAAVRLLREATVIEDGMPPEFGPPDIVKPTHELLGEVLLSLDRPAEAQREFERALELAPKRALSLRGLFRAATAAGDAAKAEWAARTLREIWRGPDLGLGAR